jgi:WD40 repeat protein
MSVATAPSAVRAARASRYVSSLSARALARAPDPGAEDQDDEDETVRLWDPITATPVGDPLTGHTHWVTAVAAVPLPDGRTLLATTSNDRTVRLWDPVTADGPPGTHHHRESRSQTYPAPAN